MTLTVALLLLPVLGVLLIDPLPADFFAVKQVGLMAGSIVCIALALRRGRLAWSPVGWALWFFVGVRAVMLLHSPMTGEAVRWWSLVLVLAVIYQITIALPDRRQLRRVAPPTLALLMGAIAILAIWQALSGARQAHAFFANRNFAGVGLAMLLPYALATRWRWPLLALGILGLLAINSRGGALAAAAALALHFTWRLPRLRWPVLVGAALVVVILALVLGETNTVKVRRHWYAAAAHMGLEHPLVGLGAGGFEREYPPVRPLEEHAISGGDHVHAVHNDYLESFAEGGLLGLGAPLFLVAAIALAVRRHRAAAASLLALAVASLVDLPLRDPSLLALATIGIAIAVPSRRAKTRGWPAYSAALVFCLIVFPLHWNHWQAERSYGRYRQRREARLLDAALASEPRHPEALLERSRPEDLDLLLKQAPHHAGAHYNRTRDLDPDAAIPALREVLTHDPHHALTLLRLAILVLDEDRLEAISLLDRAVASDPRPFEPYVVLARLHLEAGDLGAAERAVRAAEERSVDRRVARERLDLELAKMRTGRWSPEEFADAVRRVPAAEVEELASAALADAQVIEREHPGNPVVRREGETTEEHIDRIQKAKALWQAEIDPLVRPHYREAYLLAEALSDAHAAAKYLHLRARAARGLREIERAREFESIALFLEALEALLAEDEYKAGKRLRRALLAYPELGTEPQVRRALRLFLEANPARRIPLKRLCAGDAALSDAIGD
ncbi:MAG: tetratricopeptide repeat protein [Planctomycetota bacterium]